MLKRLSKTVHPVILFTVMQKKNCPVWFKFQSLRLFVFLHCGRVECEWSLLCGKYGKNSVAGVEKEVSTMGAFLLISIA